MRRHKGRIIAAIAASACLCMNSCATYDAFYDEFINKSEETYQTVKIGVFEPLSGKDRKYGELEKEGIELANAICPECMGKKVELIYEDNESDIYAAEARIKELISKKPSIILGSYGSVYSLVIGEYIEKARIPTIAVTNKNPLVTKNNPYYFRVSVVDAYQCAALAKYAAQELKVRKSAAMMPKDDDMAAAHTASFENKFMQLTGEDGGTVRIIEYEQGKTDFRKELKKLKGEGIKAVLLSASGKETVEILKTAEDLKADMIFMISEEAALSDIFRETAGDSAELAVFPIMYDSEKKVNDTGKVFLREYRKKYGEDKMPEPSVALGFDAYMIAVDALNRTGTVKDSGLLRDNIMKTVCYPGASGNITLDAEGDPMKTVAIKGIKNGKMKNIYIMEPEIVPVAGS